MKLVAFSQWQFQDDVKKRIAVYQSENKLYSIFWEVEREPGISKMFAGKYDIPLENLKMEIQKKFGTYFEDPIVMVSPCGCSDEEILKKHGVVSF